MREEATQNAKNEAKLLVDNKELATKGYIARLDAKIDLSIEKLRNELVKWVLGVGIGGIITLSGIMFTLLKLVH